jgi:hypothetical protein
MYHGSMKSCRGHTFKNNLQEKLWIRVRLVLLRIQQIALGASSNKNHTKGLNGPTIIGGEGTLHLLPCYLVKKIMLRSRYEAIISNHLSYKRPLIRRDPDSPAARFTVPYITLSIPTKHLPPSRQPCTLRQSQRSGSACYWASGSDPLVKGTDPDPDLSLFP